jgi:hypothetical protein
MLLVYATLQQLLLRTDHAASFFKRNPVGIPPIRIRLKIPTKGITEFCYHRQKSLGRRSGFVPLVLESLGLSGMDRIPKNSSFWGLFSYTGSAERSHAMRPILMNCPEDLRSTNRKVSLSPRSVRHGPRQAS